MRTGLMVSAVSHLAFIAWGVVTISNYEPLDSSEIEAIPFEFIPIDDITQIPIGLQTAEVLEEAPIPAPPEEEPPPEPEPPAPAETAPEPVEEPPPEPEPLPPEPEPEPVPEPPEPEPIPEPTEPEPLPELPPEPEIEPTPEPEPEPEPTPEPEAEVEKEEPPPQLAATPPPLPRSRPDRPVPDDSLTDDIAALLNDTAPSPADQEASVGSVTGSPSTALRQNEIDALRARLARCWAIPPTRPDPAELRVKIKMFLSPDGNLSRRPEVVEYRPTAIGQIAAEAAVSAAERCAPYNLPAANYESWKEIIMTFDPRDMFGG